MKTKIKGLLQHKEDPELTTFFYCYQRGLSNTAKLISAEYAKLRSQAGQNDFIHLLCYNELPSEDDTELEVTGVGLD